MNPERLVFPQTQAQKMTELQRLTQYLPRLSRVDVRPDLRIERALIEKEPSEWIGRDGMYAVKEILWSQKLVTSSVTKISQILLGLKPEQVGPRTPDKNAFHLYKPTWGEEFEEEVSLFRTDGNWFTNIMGSLGALEKMGIELAHPWTVMMLRKQKWVRNIIQWRQELWIPEILLLGHFQGIDTDENRHGSPTDLFYVQDTFYPLTVLDQTRPKIDGKWFMPGTAIWVWKRKKVGAPVPLAKEEKRILVTREKEPASVS